MIEGDISPYELSATAAKVPSSAAQLPTSSLTA